MQHMGTWGMCMLLRQMVVGHKKQTIKQQRYHEVSCCLSISLGSTTIRRKFALALLKVFRVYTKNGSVEVHSKYTCCPAILVHLFRRIKMKMVRNFSLLLRNLVISCNFMHSSDVGSYIQKLIQYHQDQQQRGSFYKII